MGSGSSKPEPETPAPPKVVDPVNIMVTKEVTERWAALSRKKLQQEQEETKASADDEKRSTPAPNVLVSNLPPQLKPIEGVESDKIAESKEMPSMPSSNELSLSSSKSEEDSGKFSLTEPEPEPRPISAAPLLKSEEIDEIVQNYDNLDMFANFFIPTSSLKLRYDLENGDEIQDQLVDYDETLFSTILRTADDSICENPKFLEEADENDTRGIMRKHSNSDFNDEEALISENQASGESTLPIKEIHVPKPILPVILDQDEEGKMTIETVNTWRLREKFEKEITKNNSYWTEELQRLTAKLEDETRALSDDFQVRMEDVRKRYAEVVDMPFKTGHHCNLLVSRIGLCYQQHNDQVLKCNDLVREFAKCTSKACNSK